MYDFVIVVKGYVARNFVCLFIAFISVLWRNIQCNAIILAYLKAYPKKNTFLEKFKAILMTLFSYNFPGGQSLKTNRKIRRRVYSVP